MGGDELYDDGGEPDLLRGEMSPERQALHDRRMEDPLDQLEVRAFLAAAAKEKEGWRDEGEWRGVAGIRKLFRRAAAQWSYQEAVATWAHATRDARTAFLASREAGHAPPLRSRATWLCCQGDLRLGAEWLRCLAVGAELLAAGGGGLWLDSSQPEWPPPGVKLPPRLKRGAPPSGETAVACALVRHLRHLPGSELAMLGAWTFPRWTPDEVGALAEKRGYESDWPSRYPLKHAESTTLGLCEAVQRRIVGAALHDEREKRQAEDESADGALEWAASQVGHLLAPSGRELLGQVEVVLRFLSDNATSWNHVVDD